MKINPSQSWQAGQAQSVSSINKEQNKQSVYFDESLSMEAIGYASTIISKCNLEDVANILEDENGLFPQTMQELEAVLAANKLRNYVTKNEDTNHDLGGGMVYYYDSDKNGTNDRAVHYDKETGLKTWESFSPEVPGFGYGDYYTLNFDEIGTIIGVGADIRDYIPSYDEGKAFDEQWSRYYETVNQNDYTKDIWSEDSTGNYFHIKYDKDGNVIVE